MTGTLRHLDGWVAAARGGEMRGLGRVPSLPTPKSPPYTYIPVYFQPRCRLHYFHINDTVGMADAVREFVYTAMELLQVATVTVATDRIAAAADEIDPSYSPSGANVYRI